MDNYALDYLSNLPDELKIKILSYVNTVDVMNMCEAAPVFERLAFEKQIISKVNFYKDYRLKTGQFSRFVSNKMRSESITWLNINCIYWIPAWEIRKCLSKLFNLESLYAVDTKISLNIEDCICYNSLPKLCTLAVTISDDIIDIIHMHHYPKSLTHFYMQLDFSKSHSISKLHSVFMHLHKLEELWIADLSTTNVFGTGFIKCITYLKDSLKRLTVSFRSIQDCVIIQDFNKAKVFQTSKGDQIIYETSNLPVVNFYEKQDYENDDWNVLINKLKCNPPFCVNDARKLIFENYAFDDILFEELNFCHTSCLCSKVLRDTLRNILISKNTKLLKKVSLNFCASERDNNKVLKAEYGSLPRVSCVEELIKNSPLIEEIEFWSCTFNGIRLDSINNNAFHCIVNLKYLKKLTLHDVPIHWNCSFLIDICKHCKQLTSLRVYSVKQNSALNNTMCMALSHSSSLKDLRFEHVYIPINRIFESINSSKELKLERLFLKCQRIEDFRAAPFERFLAGNQLTFLCIVITNLPKSVTRNISKVLNNFKTSSKMVMYITTDENVSGGRLLVPFIHRLEMIKCDTKISVLDSFNGFVKY